MGNKHYKAFISYSHKDEKFGKWLHKALEKYKIPKELRKDHPHLPKSLFPIFMDREELSTNSDLGTEILKALHHSEYLIIICSVHSAKSQWVNQEIIDFKEKYGEDKVHAIIIDGEPHAKDSDKFDADLECFPEALKYKVIDGKLSDVPTEPIAGDFRKGKDGKEHGKLKLISGLLGVEFDELNRREEKRKRRNRFVLGTFIAIFISLMSSFLVYISMIESSLKDVKSEIAELKLYIKSVDNQENNKTVVILNKKLKVLLEIKREKEEILEGFGLLEEEKKERVKKVIEQIKEKEFTNKKIELEEEKNISNNQFKIEMESSENLEIENKVFFNNSKILKNIVIPSSSQTNNTKNLNFITKKVALLIGNSNYSFQYLSTPSNDIESISNTLINMGFYTTTLKNASQYEIKKALMKINKETTPSTVSLIYFSGHIFQINDINYLFPTDTIATNLIDLSELIDLNYLLASIDTAKYGIVLIDASIPNPLIKSFYNKGKGVLPKEGLVIPTPNNNQIIGFSGMKNDIDNNEENISLYARYLSKRLNEDKDIRLILSKVSNEVADISQYKQHPTYNSNFSSNLVYLGNHKKETP